MKSIPGPENGHHYTSTEILAILDRAKALGVTFIKVAGFEATWGIVPAAPQTPLESSAPLGHQAGWQPRPVRQVAEGPRRAGNQCHVCGSEKVPSKVGRGVYCVQCFIAKKEREENR